MKVKDFFRKVKINEEDNNSNLIRIELNFTLTKNPFNLIQGRHKQIDNENLAIELSVKELIDDKIKSHTLANVNSIDDGDYIKLIFLTNSNNITVNEVNQLEKECLNLLSKITRTNIGTELVCHNKSIICYYELPQNISIECENFVFNLGFRGRETVSLHNIHKQLKCKSLKIISINSIKDCILGILLIKNLEDFSCGVYDKKEEWYKILKSHFDANDRDVLECQEELISNGYKEYAKL